ncbi:hypothetical protein [Aureimonas ureilytica]|uniref:hypothetical protein n=1 Tax=Aureimonas ureilytica TaxID=401562 RepID=UPI00128E9E40|nr:hypothetical protein [Aureimonas ureilytica]
MGITVSGGLFALFNYPEGAKKISSAFDLLWISSAASAIIYKLSKHPYEYLLSPEISSQIDNLPLELQSKFYAFKYFEDNSFTWIVILGACVGLRLSRSIYDLLPDKLKN